MIPSLAYILTVSGSLHLVNYGRSFAEPTAPKILHCGWKPCFFSAVTTTAGMLSLCRSAFPAVREFGVFCATGVCVSLICQLLLMPVLIERLHGNPPPSRADGFQDRVLGRIIRFRLPILVGSLLAIGVFAAGFAQLDGELEVERVFAEDSRIIREIGQLESSLGPVEQTELVLQFPLPSEEAFHDRLRTVRRVEAKLRAVPGVVSTISLATSMPEEPADGSINSTIRRAIFRRRLREAKESLADTPYLHEDEAYEAWRISIRFPFLAKTDFGALSKQALQAARETLAKEYDGSSKVETRYTGVSHLYHVAQESLIEDLLMNCALAFLLICPLMILAVRSLRLGLLAMIPNICPMVAVYGGVGLVGYPLDIGMTMTASVALGIAVDDTTHFLLRYCDLRRSEPTRYAALRSAYRQCSSAMTQTTLIAGVGLAAFVSGPLAAMTRFAYTLIALLVVALLCDLIMLPGLISLEQGVREDDE